MHSGNKPPKVTGFSCHHVAVRCSNHGAMVNVTQMISEKVSSNPRVAQEVLTSKL